jgi:hypothetical protein
MLCHNLSFFASFFEHICTSYINMCHWLTFPDF